MRDVRKFAGRGVMLLMVAMGAAGHAQANTAIVTGDAVALDLSGSVTYQYGNTTFTFSACSATVTASCSNLQLIAVTNGRGGTEIEIAEQPLKGSNIFDQVGATSSQLLNYTLNVGLLTGNRGISSVTNIVDGSVTGTPSSSTVNGLVSSGLSAFSGVTVGNSKSDLNTPSTTSTFTKVTAGHNFGFTDQLLDSSGSASNAYTLKLTDVKLLFKPAPEPSSIAVFGMGLAGLVAARRRLSDRARH